MLIKVFDSEWFDPSGIRIDETEYRTGWEMTRATRIKFGTYSQKNPEFGNAGHPVPEYLSMVDCILIHDKTPDEVAAEINRQLKELTP